MARAIEISLTNETEHYRYSDHVELLADTYMSEDATMGEIFRSCQREYGRCTSKVYIDKPAGGVQHIGWHFIKRAKYEDTGATYLQGAWVTVGEHVPARSETVAYEPTGVAS